MAKNGEMVESGIYVYVSEHGSEQISVLRMSPESGELTRVQDVPVQGKVMPLAISPDRRFMYAALRSKPRYSIVSYAIDARSGELTYLGNTPAFNSTVYICTDRTGRFLLAANNPHNYAHRTGILCISPIGEQGCVQEPYEMFRTPEKMHCVRPDPSNRFLFGTSCDGDVIVRYAFDAATGILNPEPMPPVMIERRRGPRHLLFHPNNRFLYLVNEYEGSVYAFRYDVRNGSIAEIQIASATPPGYEPKERGRLGISAAGADLHFTPNGRWLYVSVRGSLTMAVFAVDPLTGLLTSAGHFPMPNEPRGFNIDPLGRYLLVGGEKSSNLVSYRIDSKTGALTQLKEYATGDGPNWIEIVRLP